MIGFSRSFQRSNEQRVGLHRQRERFSTAVPSSRCCGGGQHAVVVSCSALPHRRVARRMVDSRGRTVVMSSDAPATSVAACVDLARVRVDTSAARLAQHLGGGSVEDRRHEGRDRRLRAAAEASARRWSEFFAVAACAVVGSSANSGADSGPSNGSTATAHSVRRRDTTERHAQLIEGQRVGEPVTSGDEKSSLTSSRS